MATYKYRARDAQGEIFEGMVDGSSETSAVAQLDALDYIPISIRELRTQKVRKFSAGTARVSQGTLILFTRQLSTMIHSGIPIITAMTALMEETDSESFKEVLARIRGDIQEGISLSEALSKHPQVFSKLYVNTVAAGEAGGVLDVILRRLSELLQHEAEIQAGVKSALRYPIAVVIALTIAFFVLTTFVVPKFVPIFEGAGVALPLPTRILILVNHIIRGYWFLIIPSIAVIAFAIKTYTGTEKGQYQWDYIKLKLPILGELVIKMVSSRFAQMLRTLDNAGLPILRSLDVISFTLGNSVFAKEIEVLRRSVTEGRGIGEPLLESKFFPKLVGHMVTIGEKSGALDDMLASIQEHYDLEVDTTVKNLTALVEPLLTVGLGLVVLFLALGIFLPMWDLISAAKSH